MTTNLTLAPGTTRHARPGSGPAPAPGAPSTGHGIAGQLLAFGAIGVVSTVAYVGLYAALRLETPSALANAIALLVTAVGNTAANRRLTFGVRGRDGYARDQFAGLLALGAALVITTGAMALLGALTSNPPRSVEVAVLVAANAVATLVRFVLLKLAIGRPGRPAPALPDEVAVPDEAAPQSAAAR